MDQLWAPWRIDFIEDLRSKKGGCIFCEFAIKGDDRSRLVLFRGKKSYVLMNKYPYNSGHLMVIPYQHTGRLSELDAETNAEIMDLGAKSVDVISGVMEPEGFNLGFNLGKCAGAGIADHVHLHIVPRWCGDTNFLPVLGDTRSIPEYLEKTYDRLYPGFSKLK